MKEDYSKLIMNYLLAIALIIIAFLLSYNVMNAQRVDIRTNKTENRKTPEISFIHPLFKVPMNDGSEENLLQASNIYFYPDQLTWIDLSNPVQQGAFFPDAIKYIELHDLKMDVATAKVNRIMKDVSGNLIEVLENRIVSEYMVIVYFNDGSTKEFQARIIANNDIHVDYPAIVPGNRWTFKASNDDEGSYFGRIISVDEGLSIDYD